MSDQPAKTVPAPDAEAEQWQEAFARFRDDYSRLREEIGKVVVGQDRVIDGTLTGLFAHGHVLLEGVPGLGKTVLVRTLADALQCRFSRIQFTPDLMPADLIGTTMLVESPEGGREFQFQPGPIFANVVLADEINRATPKTQSALLEAMQEQAVTVGGVTHSLKGLFFVMATQNPLEMEGTYPLPEAQLDRFFSKLLVQFPGGDDIEAILDRTTAAEPPRAEPCLTEQRVLEMIRIARQVPVAPDVRHYAVALVLATHPEIQDALPMTRQFVRYGASPRGAQALILAGKIQAILDGRYHVSREDIRKHAKDVLRHRLILNFEGQAENIMADQILDDILSSVR